MGQTSIKVVANSVVLASVVHVHVYLGIYAYGA